MRILCWKEVRGDGDLLVFFSFFLGVGKGKEGKVGKNDYEHDATWWEGGDLRG